MSRFIFLYWYSSIFLKKKKTRNIVCINRMRFRIQCYKTRSLRKFPKKILETCIQRIKNSKKGIFPFKVKSMKNSFLWGKKNLNASFFLALAFAFLYIDSKNKLEKLFFFFIWSSRINKFSEAFPINVACLLKVRRTVHSCQSTVIKWSLSPDVHSPPRGCLVLAPINETTII